VVDGKNYILHKVNGFAVDYSYMSELDLEALFNNPDAHQEQKQVLATSEIIVHGKNVPLHAVVPRSFSLEAVTSQCAFKTWIEGLDPRMDLQLVEVQSVDKFGPSVGFVKFKADVDFHSHGHKHHLPGVVFMRGLSVSVLVVMTERTSNSKYAIIVTQPRVAIGKAEFSEIPSGILQDGSPSMVFVRNLLASEVGIEVEDTRVTDMNRCIYEDGRPIYNTPGGSDQGMFYYLVELEVSVQQLQEMHEQTAIKRNEGAMIIPSVVPFEELPARCNDARTFTAYAMYCLIKQSRSSSEHAQESPTI